MYPRINNMLDTLGYHLFVYDIKELKQTNKTFIRHISLILKYKRDQWLTNQVCHEVHINVQQYSTHVKQITEKARSDKNIRDSVDILMYRLSHILPFEKVKVKWTINSFEKPIPTLEILPVPPILLFPPKEESIKT